MPYDIVHADRKNWLAGAEGRRRHPVRLGIGARVDARGLPDRGRAPVRGLVASFLEELETLGLREHTVFAFLSDHGESWGERFQSKEDVKGVYHMHGATLRRDRRGAADPLGTRARARRRRLAGALRRPHADAARARGASARETDGESLPHVDGDRAAIIAGTDMGALTKLAVRMPPWKLILDVESGEEEAYRLDVDPRELAPRTDAPRAARDRLP